MKIHKRLLIVTSLAFFLLAATAYASSSDFLTQAQKYINQNCSKKDITNETALLCYLFNKSQEQDTSIASLSATLSPIPSEINNLKNHQTQTDQTLASQGATINNLQNAPGKSLKVLDANNQELGVLSPGEFDWRNRVTFFIPSINKFARYASFLGESTGLFYQAADCKMPSRVMCKVEPSQR